MKKQIKLLVFLFILLNLNTIAFADSLPDMQTSLLSYSPNPVQPGQTIDLYLEVSNAGTFATNAWLEIIEEYPFTVLQTQDVERAQTLGTLSGTQTLQFRIKIDETAKDGLLPITVRFGTTTNKANYQEQQFDINIQTFDTTLSLTNIEQIPEELMPGEKGILKLTLSNFDDRPIKNVDVVLDMTNTYDMNRNMNNMLSVQAMINARLEEVNRRVASGQSPLTGPTPMMGDPTGLGKKPLEFNSIAPTGSSTHKRLKELKSGDQIVLEFEIQALPDTHANIYALPIYINYNDEDNNPFHTSTEVPIVVNMKPDALIELQSTTLRSTDFAGEVVIIVANIGHSEIKYATLELKENHKFKLLTAPQNVYLGTLKPGDSQEAKFEVIAEDKNLTLPVTLSFRDSFNKKMYIEKDLQIDIINKNYYRDLPFEMWLVWIILGAIVLFLTIYYVRNMSKKDE